MNYPFGYDPKEFDRLRDQHRVWSSRMREHWKAGGIRRGDVVLDVGCGPGFVSVDLAERGVRVLASDRNRESLEFLKVRCQREGIDGIEIVPACEASKLPRLDPAPTAAYIRWLLCYLGPSGAKAVFDRLAEYRGIRLLVHDFINYRSAHLEPSSETVQYVIETFYRGIKDADIGFALPAILERCSFEVTWKRVVQMEIKPGDPDWSWADRFFRLHVPSLRNSDAFLRDWNRASRNPAAVFSTWPVLQLVAVKK